MARNRVAYATVLPGSQYVEGVLPVVSPNYDIILDRRRTWWWEPGPVDSCCFCCHLEGGYFTVFCVLVGLAGGVAGLWAGCGRNTFAAKLFYVSWPTSLALRIISWMVWCVIIEQLNVFLWFTFMLAIQVFFYTYFMKVSWSYYTVLKTRDTNPSSSIGSGIELRVINQ